MATTKPPLSLAVFGAGRMAQIHIENAARHPDIRLHTIVDVHPTAATPLAQRTGAVLTQDATQVWNNPEIQAVIIASPTPTHHDLVIQAAQAGKAILCEKPIDLDPTKAQACLDAAAQAKVPFYVGFNRRFDVHFATLRERLAAGVIGDPELIIITSRDPAPPPIDYLKASGGLFCDMMMHDFDMARWLLAAATTPSTAAPITTVCAQGSARIDPAIKTQAGDIDTAAVILTTAAGTLCQLNASRRAVYGYDQRVEVMGSKGMLQAGNVTPSNVREYTKAGTQADNPMPFFAERYAEAYRQELHAFVEVIQEGPKSSGQAQLATAQDGLEALVLAKRATEALAHPA